ncbi:MAG TPA: hypothetical protein VJW51_06275, partial [Candidatus Acidoferrales bacterium]|nr:hypothetical protein [Candidatus Acidoferrales bacterium]
MERQRRSNSVAVAGGRSALGAVAVLGVVAALFGLFAWMKYHNEHHLLVADVPVRPVASLLGATVNPEEVHPERFPMQVAVVRTATGETLLPVEHALGQMGIPYFVTRNLQQALRHPLVVLYPGVDAKTFTAGELGQIRRHVEAGGSV